MSLLLPLHRIFRQCHEPDAPRITGADLGFTGPAASIPIDDDYQADQLRAMRGSEQRLWAAQGYFMKRHRNAVRLADECDDEELRTRLSEIREALAEHLVVVGHQIKEELESLGYRGAAEEPDVGPPAYRTGRMPSNGRELLKSVPFQAGRGQANDGNNEALHLALVRSRQMARRRSDGADSVIQQDS